MYPLAPYTTKEYSLSARIGPAPNLSMKNFSSWWSVSPSHFFSTKETLPSKNSSAKFCSTISFASMFLMKLCGGSAKSVGCTCMFCPAFIFQPCPLPYNSSLSNLEATENCLSHSLSLCAKYERDDLSHKEAHHYTFVALFAFILLFCSEKRILSFCARRAIFFLKGPSLFLRKIEKEAFLSF